MQLKQDVNILNEDISATSVMLDDASLGFERISGDLLHNCDPESRQTLSVREWLQSHLSKFASDEEYERLETLVSTKTV